ncbi:hypothetical protein CF319_g3778 [Tilletia indica]|nr:hypothetical protein CF319_g3778 [Tilletia indica]
MTEQGEGGSLQRRRSSSATATAPTGGGGGMSYSSPKLQAARERLANPTDLQLDSSTGPRRSSLRHSHLQQHSSSNNNNIHPLDRHRVLTIPVWARNEPPSPFTSPTVAPINTHHNLPSLTDLAPLEPPLLEEEDDQQQQPRRTQQQQQQPPPSSSKANLQRFSTRSSASASSSHKPHRNTTSKRWLFSRKRISVPQHAASSSTASVNLRPPSRHQQQSSSHTTHSRRPDSDSEDEDDPDAEGPERFWSFTLPPRYRNKIKDLNTFRMSSFKAAATGRAAHQAGGQGDDEEDEYEDVEEEQDQESGAAGTATVAEGKTATDRSKSEPTANQSSSTTPNNPRKTPKRNNTDLSISVLSSSSAKTTTNVTATRPVLSPASTSKRSSYVQGGATSAGAGKGKKSSQNEREKKGKKKSKDSTGTDHHHHHRPHLHRSRTSSAASSANNSSAGSSGSNNKSDEGGGGEDHDDEYVRARRASGDGTGGVGLPRGAAAAELDQSPLMSWMRRKDSSRGPGGAGGSRASTSPTSPRSPGPLGGFMFVPPTQQTSGGGKKGSQGSAGAGGGNGAAGAEDFGLPRVAEPERAHYAEPKQKQHELRLRGNGNGNGNGNGRQWTQEEEEEEGGGGGEEQGAIKAMATANGKWDEGITSAMSKGGLGGGGAGMGMGSEFSRHQPRTPGWSTPWRPTTPTSSYPFGGFGSLWGGGGGGGRGSHDDHGGLDLEKLGGLLGRHSGTAGGRLHGGPMDRKGDKQARERSYMARFRQFLLLNPFAPFAFRMINMSFTTATLAVAIRIHETLRSIGDSSLVGSSPILGIIFAPLTLAHVFTQIYMEYFGKPIGLWSVRSKLFYTLIELVFVCFWSAELSLAFDNLTTSPLECCCGASKLFRAEEAAEAINQNPERVGYVCRLQSTLAGLSFVSLLAYLIVLSVSLFRIFERLSRSQH